MSANPDPHAELGVPRDATAAEVHQAFRRRLREHHPDTRPQMDAASGSASDQALQRVLAAYATLRERAASPAGDSPAENQPPREDHTAGTPRRRRGDPPFTATTVQWVHPAGAGQSPDAGRDRTSAGVPGPDVLIRWLLGH